MKNILLLNAGTRNVLVRDFKETLKGEALVIATDNFELAPALYEADKYYVTPWITESCYWNEIDKICDREKIGLIVSLIDPELEMLANEKGRFEKKGILVNTSDYKTIHDTYDKFSTLEFLRKNGFPYIKTYRFLEDVIHSIENKTMSFPLFMKPGCGSGSQGICKIDNRDELFNSYKEGMIIQEFMSGQEIGVDVFVDMLSGEVCSIFAKKKIKMRAGETDKSVSYKNQRLFDVVKRFAKQYGLKGVNDIDVFEKNGEFYISEVNPRFGGGYLHAYACGVDFPKMLINNMNGICNSVQIGDYEENIYMMKYFDIKVINNNCQGEHQNEI